MAKLLLGTTTNVYTLIRSSFPKIKIKKNENIFDILRDNESVYLCIECNYWKDLAEFDTGADICQECLENLIELQDSE